MGARALWTLGLSKPTRVARDRLTIVTFHRVLPEPSVSPLPHLAVTPNFLRSALRFFAEHYTCLTLSKAVERFYAGDAPNRPLMAVTFDDGRKDNFLHGLPALRSTGVPATFFVPAGRVDDPTPLWHDELGWLTRHLLEKDDTDLLSKYLEGQNGDTDAIHHVVQQAKNLSSQKREKLIVRLRERAGELPLPSWEGPMPWNELRQLVREGHEIGSHSMSHDVLLDSLGANQAAEVKDSRSRIERELSTTVRSFCFPTGEYDETTLREIRSAGYESAVTTHWGANLRDADPYELRRYDIQGELNGNGKGGVHQPVLAWRLSKNVTNANVGVAD